MLLPKSKLPTESTKAIKMKWVIVTCDASAHIRPVQEWLFKKYAPSADLHYLNVGSDPVETWGQNVLKRLPNIGPKSHRVTNDNLFVVFGLDDYLPTAPLSLPGWKAALQIMGHKYPWGFYERFELGYGASNKNPFMKDKTVDPFIRKRITSTLELLEYGPETPYSVSCQFSIWDIAALKRTLSESTTPWNFETKHRAKAACFSYPVFRWIEESALSKRWPGKINVNGLAASDVLELIKLGLLDESKLINRS